MSLLSVYDVETQAGQDQAVRDILQEQNRQYDNSNQLITYQVVAYTELTLNVVIGPPSIYTTGFRHGLGFAPIVLAYLTDVSDQNVYQQLPYTQLNVSDLSTVDFTAYFFSDANSTVFAIQTTNTGFSGPFRAAFYIFNIPAVVG